MRKPKELKIQIPSDTFQPMLTDGIVNVAGDLWCVRDDQGNWFANLSTLTCTCGIAACRHAIAAIKERDRLRALGYETVPDTERASLIAIRAGLQRVNLP